MTKRAQSTHEAFERDEQIVAGSDRSFGFVMAGAFALLSLLNAWHVGRIWPWTGGLAALFLAAALFRPAVLNPLNRIWLKFGLLLHRIVNPLIMALLFYGTVLPTATSRSGSRTTTPPRDIGACPASSLPTCPHH